MDGSTLVSVYGRGYVNTGFARCKFGDDGPVTVATYISEGEVACMSSPKAAPVGVRVYFTWDGQHWESQKHYRNFQYLMTPVLKTIEPAQMLFSDIMNVTVTGSNFVDPSIYGVKPYCRCRL